MATLEGSNLNVCSEYISGEQCCSQLNEDELGMRLNNAIRYNHTLGTEVRVLKVAVTALNSALSSKHYRLNPNKTLTTLY